MCKINNYLVIRPQILRIKISRQIAELRNWRFHLYFKEMNMANYKLEFF